MIIFRKTKTNPEDRRIISALALNYEANQVISAAKVDDLKAKHPEFVEQIDKVFAADPTPQKKYLQWATDRVVDGDNVDEVIEVMTEFNVEAHRLPHKDIYNKSVYKTLKDVVDALNEVSKDRVGVSEKQFRTSVGHGSKDSKHLVKTKEADYLYHSKNLLVVFIKTKKASCHFGFGTGWCITIKEANFFNDYSKNYNDYFYFIIDKNKSTEGVAKPERAPPNAKVNDPWAKVALEVKKAQVVEGPGGIPGISDIVAWPLDDNPRPLGQVLMHFKKLYGREIFEALDTIYEHVAKLPDNWSWILESSERVKKAGGYKALYDAYKNNEEFKKRLVSHLQNLSSYGEVDSSLNELFVTLAKDPSPEVRLTVASKTSTPEVADILLTDHEEFGGRIISSVALATALIRIARSGVLAAGDAWGPVLEKAIVQNGQPAPTPLRVLMAQNCPASVLAIPSFKETFNKLLTDSNPGVISGLMKNQNLPDDIRSSMAESLVSSLEAIPEGEEVGPESINAIRETVRIAGPVTFEKLLKIKNEKLRKEVATAAANRANSANSDEWLGVLTLIAQDNSIDVRETITLVRYRDIPKSIIDILVSKDVNKNIAYKIISSSVKELSKEQLDRLVPVAIDFENLSDGYYQKIIVKVAETNYIYTTEFANKLLESKTVKDNGDYLYAASKNMPLQEPLPASLVKPEYGPNPNIFDFYLAGINVGTGYGNRREGRVRYLGNNKTITSAQIAKLIASNKEASISWQETEIIREASTDRLNEIYNTVVVPQDSASRKEVLTAIIQSKNISPDLTTRIIDNLAIADPVGGELAPVSKWLIVNACKTILSNASITLSEENLNKLASLPEALYRQGDAGFSGELAENKATSLETLQSILSSIPQADNWYSKKSVYYALLKNPKTTSEMIDTIVSDVQREGMLGSIASLVFSNKNSSMDALTKCVINASAFSVASNEKSTTEMLLRIISREIDRVGRRGADTSDLVALLSHPNTPIAEVLKYASQKKNKVSDAAKEALKDRPDRPPPPKRGRKPKTAVEPAAEAAPVAAEEVVVEAAYLKEAVHSLAEIFHLLPVSAFALLAIEEAAALLEE